VNLIGSYDYTLVALSVLIAIFASYAALDLAGRVTAARDWTRAAWLLGGAGAMGTGIWSMHYIGMLAFILPIPVAYHWPTVLLSLLAAILASAVALGVVSRPKMGWFRAVVGSVLMGAGIAGMHYIGMAAMRLPAMCTFNSFLVVLSVVFAILISLAALWITFHFRDERTAIRWEKLAGAVVMGAAIPVMHYTGMAAARFSASAIPVDLSRAVSISTIGAAGIAAATFIVLALALLTSWVDRRFASHALQIQEARLQQSETYLSEAQRLSHTGSFGWSVSSGEIMWSEETFRIFQYDCTMKPTVELVLQRVHPKDATLVKETIERAAKNGNDFAHEFRLVMPEGTVKYVHVVAHAVRDKLGGIELVGAVMDVTQRRRADEALREREAYLAEAQRLSHTGSWALIPAPGEIRYMSEECYRVLGFEPQGGLPRFETFLQRVHPDDRAKVREIAELARREKVGYEVDYRIVHPDSEVRDIYSVGYPVLSPSGDLVESVGTVMDVTERKRAEEALRRSEGYLAEAQRLSQTGSWASIPAAGEIRYMSEECYRVLGFDPRGGQPRYEMFFQSIHPDDQARVREAVETAGRENAEFELDYRIIHPGGNIRDIHVIGHPVLKPSRDPVEFVGTVMDVTERRRADEERERLRQAQADLAYMNRVTTMSELAASLAHEIKQPIAAAVTDANTCLRWLTREQPDVEEARQTAARMVKDAARAAEIISRIRLLFQKGASERELLDVNEIIREMIVLLQSEATRYSITVRTEMAEDLPPIMGDRVQLQQVIMNLIINGVDAMRDAGGTRELVIKTRRSENAHLILSFSDTGIGLPPQRDQIFNAFFTTKAHGTGMGLPISRSIVESHGGRLWAGDNSPSGASFYVTLPTTIEARE
jgi:PAS domain S-box-containing protein